MKKFVILDCGHGRLVSGKECSANLDVNRTKEWTITNNIACLIESNLKDWSVIRTDDRTGNTNVSLNNRVAIANNIVKDNPNCMIYFVSLHCDANPTGSTSGSGITVHHYGNTVRETQAKELYNLLVAHTGLKGNRSTPVRKTAFQVIAKTLCPAFLCELGYMDNAHDVPIILSDDYARKSAQAIIDFLHTR